MYSSSPLHFNPMEQSDAVQGLMSIGEVTEVSLLQNNGQRAQLKIIPANICVPIDDLVLPIAGKNPSFCAENGLRCTINDSLKVALRDMIHELPEATSGRGSPSRRRRPRSQKSNPPRPSN